MPELPEVTVISRQMNKEITGKTIAELEVKQPKNLNIPVATFIKRVKGKKIEKVYSMGKWIFTKLDLDYHLLMNLGMGGDLIYFKPGAELPEKYQFKLTFSDKSGFTAHFWWFGYIHLVNDKKLANHKMTSRLVIQPTDEKFTLDLFKNLLINRRSRIKNFLMDQKNIAGIGNVYIQDILFKARLHPNRLIPTLSDTEVKDLYKSIKRVD
jgi:formamidopyrimidine-DNA glycosylase